MPGWAGSSWYMFRYMDPHNTGEFVSKKALDYWKDVDVYIGGSEHGTGHLLYVRYWTKFLYDMGLLPVDEPAKKLINQGMIQGWSSLTYRLKIINYNVKQNNISVDEVIKAYAEEGIFLPIVLISKNKLEQVLKGNVEEKELGEIKELIFTRIKEHYNSYSNINISFEIDYSNCQKLNVPIEYTEEVSNDASISKLDINASTVWIKQFQNAKNVNFVLEDDGSFFCSREIEKMSKSKYNVVTPDLIVSEYGADTLRLYEMFLGPLEQSKPWNTQGIEGVHRFLKKLWGLFYNRDGNYIVVEEEPNAAELKVLHRTIKKAGEDVEGFSFNTSVSAFMICVNELLELNCHKKNILEQLLVIVSPYAPHICEELWNAINPGTTIIKTEWPLYNAEYLVENTFQYPVSVNGKLRLTLELALDLEQADVEKAVMQHEVVRKWTEGKEPKKIVFVKGRIVNVVV